MTAFSFLLFCIGQSSSEKAYIMAQVVDTQGLICEINRGKESEFEKATKLFEQQGRYPGAEKGKERLREPMKDLDRLSGKL